MDRKVNKCEIHPTGKRLYVECQQLIDGREAIYPCPGFRYRRDVDRIVIEKIEIIAGREKEEINVFYFEKGYKRVSNRVEVEEKVGVCAFAIDMLVPVKKQAKH
jgi:hypothetical protein